MLDALSLSNGFAEPALVALAHCAALVAHCPTARISFFDQERQHVKADVGFEMATASVGAALCREAQRRRTPMLVSDLKRDPRFAKEAIMLGSEALRFYAGFPVGLGVCQFGVLCVIDTQPRHLQPEQIDALAALAQSVGLWLDNRQGQALIAERDSRLRDFLALVREQLWECDADCAMTWCSPPHEGVLASGCSAACVLGNIDAPLEETDAAPRVQGGTLKSLLARREGFVQRLPPCPQHPPAAALELAGMPRWSRAGAFLGYRGTLRLC